MNKIWLVGVSALAMMTGSAYAQSTLSDTTTTTHSTTARADGTYTSSKTQKSIDSNGVQVDKSQTYTSGGNGTNASSSTLTTAPNGSHISSSHDERIASPSGESTTTSHTTTSGQ